MNKRGTSALVLLAVAMFFVAQAQADFLREWVRPAVFHVSRLAAGTVSGIAVDWVTVDMYKNEQEKREAISTVAKIFIAAYAPKFINDNSRSLPNAVSWLQPYDQVNRPGTHAYYVGIGANNIAYSWGVAAKEYFWKP